MPDDKLDGLGSDDDDPFEGVEISADAPEPTQEEMDEWATLDTPDEGGSPVSTRQDAKPVATTPASAAVSTPVAAPAVSGAEKKEKADDQTKKAEVAKEATSTPPPASAEPAAIPKDADASSTLSQPEQAATKPAAEATGPPQKKVELSEISPLPSPEPAHSAPAAQPSNADHDPENPLYLGGDGKGAGEGASQHQRGQRLQQGGAGWGGGWGAGWGLGALGGKLREVAAGAVRDVKELSESFQAALADVTGAEDEVERARLISAMDRAEESKAYTRSVGGAAAQDPEEEEQEAAEASAAGALPTDAPRQASEPARPAGRSAGGSARVSAGGAGDAGGSGGPPEDPALEAGLQAIDAQVEQLATGAARAISSLWGGLSTVAKVVAAEVAASVADVQSSEAVRGVAQIGTKIAHTAERGLETVGRTAMTLLEEVAGVGGALPGRRRIWGEEADARAADMGRDPSSFQDFFYIYGGEQLAEEVGNLANECSHLCNRSRSKLEADQQAALDDALARLGPYFNDPWVSAAAATGTAAAAAVPPAPALSEDSKDAAERLGHMYDPIGYLCQDSQSRSEAFLHQLVDAVETARQERPAAAEGRKKRAGDSRPGDERQALLQETRDAEAAAAAAAKTADEEGDEEWQQLRVDPQPLLDGFRAHFTKRLAEVATAQLQLLLNLGASLAAPARTGRPAVDGISWPESSEQQAALLAVEAQRMVADLATIAAAYRATIADLRAHLEKAPAAAAVASAAGSTSTPAEGEAATGAEASSVEAGSSAEGEKKGEGEEKGEGVVDVAVLDELEGSLTLAAESAAAAIKSGYKGLLYAVLLRSLVTQIAQQREEEEKEAEEEKRREDEEAGKEEGSGLGQAAAAAAAAAEDVALISLEEEGEGSGAEAAGRTPEAPVAGL